MEPRYGRLYAAAVLRPLAEQLVAEVGARQGDRVCDLMCDSGTLTTALAPVIGREGSVALVDTDESLLRLAVEEVRRADGTVSAAVAAGGVVPLADASCDRVASLCTFGFWDGASLFDEAARVAGPRGTVAVIAWDKDAPPVHEETLVDALHAEAGIRSEFLRRCLSGAVPGGGAWEDLVVRDVARFDGIAQYWQALVVERPVAAELAALPRSITDGVRAACERRLHHFIAADGTIRLPVMATLWRRGPEGIGR